MIEKYCGHRRILCFFLIVALFKYFNHVFIFKTVDFSSNAHGFSYLRFLCKSFFFLTMKTEISLIRNGNTFTSEYINQTAKNIRG